jgi:glutamine synthetase
MDPRLSLSCNPIVKKLQKTPGDFSRQDIIDYIEQEGIRHLNFMYPASDGRLKTLNFIVNNAAYLGEILSYGERVDGSSLFPFIEADSSDLYVVPRYRTAFIDPFASLPTLCMLCSFFNKDGEALENSPEYTLQKACAALKDASGMDFEAMGELEYYVIADENKLYPGSDQRGYHESAPYAKFSAFRQECMLHIAQAGGQIKYGHSEVGSFTLQGKSYEQHEIEFLPVPAMEAAEQLLVGKWIIRNLASRYGLDLTFAPKITAGKAGSGMHVHMRLMKNGSNQMLEDGKISLSARRAIAGMMALAPSLTAFGNTNPSSYLRLVPHQEAPTNVCWGDRNRSVLLRVPLGWDCPKNLSALVNPRECSKLLDCSQKQTVELRSPDASADVYLLLAGLAVACRHGLCMPDALEQAAKTYVKVNIHRQEHEQLMNSLAKLPDSCAASADCLASQRAIYEEKGVFSSALINAVIEELRAYQDQNLRQELINDQDAMLRLVQEHFHCG